MDAKRLLGNFSVAVVAQGASLVLSVLISFLVPKLLGSVEFGYWQLFIFYTSYAGFFMLGINDGIYLINGGKAIDRLNRKSIASQFICGMTIQVFFATVIGLVGFCLVEDTLRSFVLVMTGVYLVISNAAGFLGYVFQTVNETQWYSKSILISKIVLLPLVLLLVAFQIKDAEVYVVTYTVSQCCALVYCLIKARFLFAVGLLPPLRGLKETFASAKVGINLTIANVASMLVLGVARFVVDAEWGIETFGQFSFALTLENFFLTFVAQLAMVLFPALRQSSTEEKKQWFVGLRDGLSLLFPIAYVLYFPLSLIVSWWLPAYAEAVHYLTLLLPICVFESKMSLVGTTYYKVLRGERQLLTVNIATMILSAAGVLIGVHMARSLEFVMIWVTITIAVRGIYSEHWTGARIGVEKSRLWLQEVGLTVLFVASCYLVEPVIAFALVFMAQILFLAFNKDVIRSLLSHKKS